MVTTASGVIAEPKQSLADMVAASSTFQAKTGAANAADAANFVKLAYQEFYELAGRPLAMIENEDGSPHYELIHDGNANGLWPSGRLLLFLRYPDEAPGDFNESQRLADNFFGNVFQEIIDNAGVNAYLTFAHAELDGGPYRSSPDQDNQRVEPSWEAKMMFDWGAVQ